MADYFGTYMRGQQLGMQQGQNMLARQKYMQDLKDKQTVKNILSKSYTPAMEAAPAQGPILPDAAPLPDYPAQPSAFDREQAMADLLGGGYLPEAGQLQSLASASAPGRDWQAWQPQLVNISGKLQYAIPTFNKSTQKTEWKPLAGAPGVAGDEGMPDITPTEETPQQKRQREINAALRKEQALAEQKTRRGAGEKLEKTEIQAERQTEMIDDLLKHPGLEDSFGVKSYLPILRGTDRADFEAKLEQLEDTVFLSNREQLKGGGAITDFEGKKAAGAEIALSRAQNPEQFRKALNDYKYWVNRGIEKLRKKSGKSMSAQDKAALQWANANPNDERAMRILKKLGQR